MARIDRIGSDRHVVLSREEAVSIIALLAGQLGNVPLPGQHAGACPTIRVVEGDDVYRMHVVLTTE